jgi:hypothetical protein
MHRHNGACIGRLAIRRKPRFGAVDRPYLVMPMKAGLSEREVLLWASAESRAPTAAAPDTGPMPGPAVRGLGTARSRGAGQRKLAAY